MDMQQKLDPSSPIVQRVFRLRERAVGHTIDAETVLTSPATATDQIGQTYQWQMWQKSDFSAYVGDVPGHSCK